MSRILLSLVAFFCWGSSVVLAHDACCQQHESVVNKSCKDKECNDVLEEGPIGGEDDIWKSEADEEKPESLSEQYFDPSQESIGTEESCATSVSPLEEDLSSDATFEGFDVASSSDEKNEDEFEDVADEKSDSSSIASFEANFEEEI